jgi:hypothetical protein
METEAIVTKQQYSTPKKSEKKDLSYRTITDESPLKDTQNQYDMSSWRDTNLCLWMEFESEMDRREGRVLTGKRVRGQGDGWGDTGQPERWVKRE